MPSQIFLTSIPITRYRFAYCVLRIAASGLTQMRLVADKAKSSFLEMLAELRPQPTVEADETKMDRRFPLTLVLHQAGSIDLSCRRESGQGRGFR